MTVVFQGVGINNYKNIQRSNRGAVSFLSRTPKKDELQLSANRKNENREASIWKKTLFAVASIAASTAICIACLKKPDEMQKLKKGFTQLRGNNALLDEDAKKYMNAVDEMVSVGEEGYLEMLEKIKGILKPCEKDVIPADGIVYHGTSMENAAKIGKTGITPFAPSGHGAELGRAIYTTPDKRVADYIATEGNFEGVVLSFKLNTDKIAHVNQDTIMEMNQIITEYYYKYAPKTQSFADAGIELPSLTDSLLAKIGLDSDNMKFLAEIRSVLFNRLFREAGYDVAYMDKAIESDVSPILFETITDTLEKKGIKQSQIAIFDGTKIEAFPDRFTKGEKLNNKV